MTSPMAVIFGCEGFSLSGAEKSFFKEANPLGFILFARNVDNPDQVRALTAELRSCIGRADAPILIDQEGGRVQRLKPHHWRDTPKPSLFSDLYLDNPEAGLEAVHLNARIIADDLYALGIDVDCLPVLDIPQADSHPFLSGRAAGNNTGESVALGKATCEGLLDGGVLPILKHIPGHGRATADSHHDLPQVATKLDELKVIDFEPFKALSSYPWAMSAHVVYSDIDAERPASTSPKIIDDIIRGYMGFDGFLVSDDIGMNALEGNMAERAMQCLNTDSDAILHCNGDMAEMIQVADVCPTMSSRAMDRFNQSRAFYKAPLDFDRKEAEQRLDDLLGSAST